MASLPHDAGLNPRAYRQPPSATVVTTQPPPGVDAGMGRTVVDGAVLARWGEMAAQRRGEIAGRVGLGGVDEVRALLEGLLGWGGLKYF